MMKKAIILGAAMALCLSCVSCQSPKENKTETKDSGSEMISDNSENGLDLSGYDLSKLIPNYERVFDFNDGDYERTSGMRCEVSVTHFYDFEEAFAKADIVAAIRIDAVDCTFVPDKDVLGYMVFSATITDIYKGNKTVGEEIFIAQRGSPYYTPTLLFKAGDEMLLCMEKKDVDFFDEYYDEVYFPFNYTLPPLRLVTLDGERYVVNQCAPQYCSGIEDQAVNEELRDSVLEKLTAYDEMLGKTAYEVYRLETFEE